MPMSLKKVSNRRSLSLTLIPSTTAEHSFGFTVVVIHQMFVFFGLEFSHSMPKKYKNFTNGSAICQIRGHLFCSLIESCAQLVAN